MNQDIICIYYSRTGYTEHTMRELARALDCELAEVCDSVKRSGASGWLRCGLDAMRRKTKPVNRPETARALSDYKLVILGTPVWAGRCSSVMRGFLKRRGYEISNAAYVITHRSAEDYRQVFDQMDLYLLRPHVAEMSLRPAAPDDVLRRGKFLRECVSFTGGTQRPGNAEESARTVETETE